MPKNVYNQELAIKFRDSDSKPDKQYSFLPTIMSIADNLSGKTAVDLGCGDGFFTIPLAEASAQKVIGIDNAPEQIRLANEKKHPENISYELKDVFKGPLPLADLILCPFVANYSENTEELKGLFLNIYNSLKGGGKLILVVDLPKGKNLKKFGSIKTLSKPAIDGSEIKIDLYNGEDFICTLFSRYYTPKTIETALENIGFENIKWHTPIVSQAGIDKFGEDFWKDFSKDSELGYLSADKG